MESTVQKIEIPASYKEINKETFASDLRFSGYESIDRQEMNNKSFLPTWRIKQSNTELTGDAEKTPTGTFYLPIYNPASDETTYEVQESLEGTLVAVINQRMKKDIHKKVVCFSEYGKEPDPAFKNVYSKTTCKDCSYFRMKKDEIPNGENGCKNQYRFLILRDDAPDTLQSLVLTSGNWKEVMDLIARVDTGKMVPELPYLRSLYAFRFKITTEKTEDASGNKFYNAQFELIGVNEPQKVIDLDTFIAERAIQYLSPPVTTALPESLPPVQQKPLNPPASSPLKPLKEIEAEVVDPSSDEIPF